MMRASSGVWKLAVVMLIAAALSAPVAAQDTSSSGGAPKLPMYRLRLMGIYDDRSGDPVEGADVIDVMSGVSAKTTSTGTVALAYLPDGGGMVRIRKVGFEPQTMMVSISPTDTIPLTILLKHVNELAAMVAIDSSPKYTSPGLRGFEGRRRDAASGSFISEAQIRKEEGRTLGNLLVAKFGVTIKQGRLGQMTLMQSPRCGKGGPPAVLLDGIPVTPTPVNLSDYDLGSLAGIEYYPMSNTAPPQFNATATSCGVLLLWSRQ